MSTPSAAPGTGPKPQQQPQSAPAGGNRARDPSPAETDDGFMDSSQPAGGRNPRNQPSGTTKRTAANQAMLAGRKPKALINKTGALFAGYKPAVKIEYSEVKVGIMPDIAGVIQEIADQAGVSLADEEQASRFLEALVTDVYVNAYSENQSFDGTIVVGTYELDRVHIRNVITKYVGAHYRRYARALAPLVVQVMHDNYDTFGELLDKRCVELNLNTRAEAVRSFDGADALAHGDRDTARRNAEAKAVALRYKQSSAEHGLSVGNSARSLESFVGP